MNIRFFLLLLFLPLFGAEASDFEIFAEGGRFGIKDDEGAVVVPAIYEGLGWSDGSTEFLENVIGFKEGGKWGLVSVKNKVISESEFHSVVPFTSEYIKASKKDRYSNQLYYGLLDLGGDVEISFHYSSLQLMDQLIIASVLDEQKNTKTGILDFEEEVRVPISFKSIEKVQRWIVADRYDLKKNIYDKEGKPLVNDIDSIQLFTKGLACYSSGLAGFMTDKNKLKYGFDYKGFEEDNGSVKAVDFPQWEVYRFSEQIASWACDSLAQQNGIWVTYLNGAQHLALETTNEQLKEYDLMEVSGDQMVVKHTQTEKWAVYDRDGGLVFNAHDYIRASDRFYFAQKDKKWFLFNRYGSKVNNLPFDAIREGVETHFITKRDGYWGLTDFQGEIFVQHKYDSIYRVPEGYYIVQFFGKWGIMNKYGNWMINPNFQKLEVHGRLILGVRGALKSFFYDGLLFSNTVFDISHIVGEVPILMDSGRYGLINPTNSMLYKPAYDSIEVKDELILFHNDGAIKLINLDGTVQVDYEEEYEDFGEYSYGYISVKKNGRWGFIDRKSRLRIANRYDEVRPFKEGFAAVKLKGRWGFVDVKERLAIQPFYDEVSTFQDGIAIFQNEGGYGLVNPFGEEEINGLQEIKRLPTGNFYISNKNDEIGLVDKSGNYILRPAFEDLVDTGDGAIVQRGGRMGVIDYKGNQQIRINYALVKKTGDYFIAKPYQK